MNNWKSNLTKGMLALVIGFSALGAPVSAHAQSSKHRQEKKNEWRNLAIGSGALGVIGLLRHDNTLFFAGSAGALYSAWRYEQDRKSQSKADRARAAYFSKSYFYRDGHKYTRKTTWKNGKRYYYFARSH